MPYRDDVMSALSEPIAPPKPRSHATRAEVRQASVAGAAKVQAEVDRVVASREAFNARSRAVPVFDIPVRADKR